jgi:hypothetical protein
MPVDERSFEAQVSRANRLAYRFFAAWLLAAAVLVLPQGGQAATIFPVKGHPEFPQPTKRLRDLVGEKGERSVNHFCIIGYREGEGENHAWVHWREQKALILWEPAADPLIPISLAKSRRYLRLEHDVVVSEADVAGSTYLVTRAFVDGVLSDCKKHGVKFEIKVNRKADTKQSKQ